MRLRLLVMAFAAMAMLGGCATFSLGGGKAIVRDGDTSPEAVFRRQALGLQKAFTQAGWLRSGESQSRTRTFMAILSRGWGHKKDAARDKPAPDAAALYLARLRDKNGGDAGKTVIALQGDMARALMLMSELNDSTAALIAARTASDAEALRLDVKLLEQALIDARKAQSLFADAMARLEPTLPALVKTDMQARLDANEREVQRMQSLADALNARRLALPPSS